MERRRRRQGDREHRRDNGDGPVGGAVDPVAPAGHARDLGAVEMGDHGDELARRRRKDRRLDRGAGALGGPLSLLAIAILPRPERGTASRPGPVFGRMTQKPRRPNTSRPAHSPLPACGERVRPSAETSGAKRSGGEGAVPEEALGFPPRLLCTAPSPSPASQACRLRKPGVPGLRTKERTSGRPEVRRPSPRRRGEANPVTCRRDSGSSSGCRPRTRARTCASVTSQPSPLRTRRSVM